MADKIDEKTGEKINIKELFEVIGKNAFFRDRAEEKLFVLLPENEQLRKTVDELQGLLKKQAESKI